jgi:hypothetical protein
MNADMRSYERNGVENVLSAKKPLDRRGPHISFRGRWVPVMGESCRLRTLTDSLHTSQKFIQPACANLSMLRAGLGDLR